MKHLKQKQVPIFVDVFCSNNFRDLLFFLPGDLGATAHLGILQLHFSGISFNPNHGRHPWPPHSLNLAIAKSLRQGYDIDYDALFDMQTIFGFLNALRLLLRIRPRGLAWLAIPCNSFGWMSFPGHRRSWQSPYGNLTNPFVWAGNQVCTRSCLLIVVGLVRSVFFFVENPRASLIQAWPYLNYLVHQSWLRGIRTTW